MTKQDDKKVNVTKKDIFYAIYVLLFLIFLGVMKEFWPETAFVKNFLSGKAWTVTFIIGGVVLPSIAVIIVNGFMKSNKSE